MQKTIKVGEQTIKLVSSGATPVFYSNAFHRDFFKDFGEVMKFAEGAREANADGDDISKVISIFDNVVISRFLDFTWVYAYNADRSIPPVDEWLEGFETFPVFDVLEDVIDLMMTSLTVKKASGTSTRVKKRST